MDDEIGDKNTYIENRTESVEAFASQNTQIVPKHLQTLKLMSELELI